MDHGNVKRWCKGRWEGWDDPLLGTKIAPLALDYESFGKRLGTRQNTYTPTTGVWKGGTGRRKLDSGRERCVREEYLLFGFPRAQFLKTAVQQKGAVLRPGYSDTRPSWPEYGLLFYLNLSKSARACQISSLHDLFEPYFARAFFSGFLTTEVQGAPSKSLVFLLFQRIFWSTFSFIRLFALHCFYKISWKQTFRRLFTCPWVFNDIL